MSEPYEEIVEGETYLRKPPGGRHELICSRLHEQIAISLADTSTTRLLPRRSVVQVASGTMVRPDIAIHIAATGKIWLAAEIVSSDDHRADTVIKKAIYEDLNLPRLWMIDPRYNNVEIYHGSLYGLALKGILANREILTEMLLPGFEIVIKDLFEARD
jgi:Uma2 family endonuclease